MTRLAGVGSESLAPPRRNPLIALLLCCVVLLLGLRQNYVVPATGLGLSPAYLLAAVCGILWIYGKLLGETGLFAGVGRIHFALLWQFLSLLVGLFVLFSHPALAGAESESNYLVAFVLVALSLVVMDGVHSWQEVDRIVRWLVAAGVFAAATALLASTVGADIAGFVPPGLRAEELQQGPISRAGIDRVQGTAAHPLEMAAVMTALIPLSLYCLTCARQLGRRTWPWLIATLVILAAGTLSVSRSFFVGLGVIVVVHALRWPLVRVARLLAAVVGASVVVLLVSTDYFSSFVELFTKGSNDNSLQHRGYARDFALRMFLEHPLVGIGTSRYDATLFPVLDNQYLGVLVENGLLGLIGFAGVLLAALTSVLRKRRVHVDPLEDLATALASSMAALVVINTILDTAGFAQVSAITAILVGLCGAHRRLLSAKRR